MRLRESEKFVMRKANRVEWDESGEMSGLVAWISNTKVSTARQRDEKVVKIH